jgi:cell division protein FtsW
MKKFDVILLVSIIVMIAFGLLMIYDASSVIAFRDFKDKYHYIKDQLIWVVLGFIGLSVAYRFPYKNLYNLALPFLAISLGLLIAVFIPGIGVSALGAHRWINLHFTVLQPTEFVKLCLAIYLAAWFSTKETGRLPAFALLLGSILFFVMLQPDMGTASIIMAEAIIMYFLSGGNMMHFAIGMPVLGVLGFIFIKLEPYRAARLASFMNTGSSLENVSYHVKQILIALGSGGLFGVGLGNSIQKYAYLPENVTDSIFAIVAEEFGFFGSVILMGMCFVIIWRGFMIAGQTKDQFGKLLAAGITSFLGLQMAVNLAAMTALVPLTGVPLPFISYGGSALIVDMIAIGVLLNISKQ